MSVADSEKHRPHPCGRCETEGLIDGETCETCFGWGYCETEAWNYCQFHRCNFIARMRGCPICAIRAREQARLAATPE